MTSNNNEILPCELPIDNGSPGLVGFCTHDAVVYMDYMYTHMIGNGSPGLLGLSTHDAVVYMDYMYAHMIGAFCSR